MLDFANKILGAAVPCALMGTGLYFLARLKFLPITKFYKPLRAQRKNGGGSFRALALSLAGTLGVGNIVGVASAIYSGGLGAIFWMWVSAAVAAVLKYSEIVLAMRHRITVSGGFKGGAPYYIRDCLSRHFPALGAAVASLFALLCAVNCFSMGAVMQTNTVAEAFFEAFGAKRQFCGIAVALLTLIVTLGGAKRIMRLTSALVPFMSLVYVLLSLLVIVPRYRQLPAVFSEIFASAFTAKGVMGGAGGFLFSRALRFGVMRGLFSNEAGCGTSPTAHISSNSQPCEQGFMGILEVFIDTVLLCTMTAFVLALGGGETGESPMRSVISAYSSSFSPPFGRAIEVLMALMVFCFGFATVSCLAHYALECIGFLFKRVPRALFALAYSAVAFIGASVSSDAAWAVSDATVGVMTLINLAVLLLSRKEIADETALYFDCDKNISKFDKKFTKCS